MKLSRASLEWARNHINKYYDSDFYVKPFEFEALWANWDEIISYLSEKNLEELITHVKRPIALPTPKNSGGYRIVHQLDPIDTIIYTAMTREIAEVVEENRINKDDGVVFSYRINIKDSGELFEDGNGYNAFKQKSVELSNSYKYVLVTDITDFYNQIYHHRLQNSIQACDSSLDEISKLFEKFMLGLTNGVSRGIPVGPSPSIVMAEVLLNDIDEFILGKGLPYIRYVDDFRIFSNDWDKLNNMLHDLTVYLYSNHRLVLSSSKTKILESIDYLKDYISDPIELEKTEMHNSIKEFDVKVTGDYGFFELTQTIDKLPPESKIKAQGKAFESLMNRIIEFGKLDLGLARHILRRSKNLKSRAILNQLLLNFDFFTPVIRDVVLYLQAVTNDKMFEYKHELFEEIIEQSRFVKLPHIRYWLSYYFATTEFTSKYPKLSQFVLESNIREQALYAVTQKRISWVREHKDRIDQVGPWDRRAIIYSSRILSKDERTHWMNAIIERGDLVDRSLALYVKTFS